MANDMESTLSVVLLALGGIVALGRVSGAIAQRYGQPQAVGEISGGVVFGLVLALVWPDAIHRLHGEPGLVLSVLAQLGIVLMMFQVGMEFNFELLRDIRIRRSVFWITAAGLLAPLAFGTLAAVAYARYQSIENPLSMALLVGLTLSVTALPILGRILLEREWQGSRLGVTVIAVAGLEDVIGWIALGAAVILVAGQSLTEVAHQLVLITAFVGIMRYVACPLLIHLERRVSKDWCKNPNGLGLFVVCVLLAAAATSFLGIFAVVGAFLLGVSLYQCRSLLEEWNRRVTPFVNVVLVPVFFVYSGMNIDLAAFDSLNDFYWLAFWTVVAFASKFGGCGLAARLNGNTWADALCIGALLNTRALMGLVMLNVGLELSLIPVDLYSVLVVVVLLSTVITAPALNWIAARQQRLPPPQSAPVSTLSHGRTGSAIKDNV